MNICKQCVVFISLIQVVGISNSSIAQELSKSNKLSNSSQDNTLSLEVLEQKIDSLDNELKNDTKNKINELQESVDKINYHISNINDFFIEPTTQKISDINDNLFQINNSLEQNEENDVYINFGGFIEKVIDFIYTGLLGLIPVLFVRDRQRIEKAFEHVESKNDVIRNRHIERLYRHGKRKLQYLNLKDEHLVGLSLKPLNRNFSIQDYRKIEDFRDSPALILLFEQIMSKLLFNIFSLRIWRGKWSENQAIDFSFGEFENCLFYNADMPGVKFSKANLKSAKFWDDDYNRLACKNKLEKANLSNAVFKEAILTEADLTKADLNGADLNGADLNGAILTKADLNGAILINAKNLTSAQIKSANNWESAIYEGHWDETQKAWIVDQAANDKYINDLKSQP